MDEMCKCGTKAHGFVVDTEVFGLWLDLMILKIFTNLNDSKIL